MNSNIVEGTKTKGVTKMTKITSLEDVKKYGELKTVGDGLGFQPYKKLTKEQEPAIMGYLRANKPAILAQVKTEEAEKEARRAEEQAKYERQIRFWVVGWEGHEVSVDPEEDVEEQLIKIAERYAESDSVITYEKVKEAYEEKLEKIAKSDAQERAEVERVEEIKATAKSTGEKQLISRRTYTEDTEQERIWIHVSTWAMPDGTIEETRQDTI